jgi:hypothetical protein
MQLVQCAVFFCRNKESMIDRPLLLHTVLHRENGEEKWRGGALTCP